MKNKKKILTGLACAVPAIGVATPLMMLATSCNKTTDTKNHVEYYGETKQTMAVSYYDTIIEYTFKIVNTTTPATTVVSFPSFKIDNKTVEAADLEKMYTSASTNEGFVYVIFNLSEIRNWADSHINSDEVKDVSVKFDIKFKGNSYEQTLPGLNLNLKVISFEKDLECVTETCSISSDQEKPVNGRDFVVQITPKEHFVTDKDYVRVFVGNEQLLEGWTLDKTTNKVIVNGDKVTDNIVVQAMCVGASYPLTFAGDIGTKIIFNDLTPKKTKLQYDPYPYEGEEEWMKYEYFNLLVPGAEGETVEYINDYTIQLNGQAVTDAQIKFIDQVDPGYEEFLGTYVLMIPKKEVKGEITVTAHVKDLVQQISITGTDSFKLEGDLALCKQYGHYIKGVELESTITPNTGYDIPNVTITINDGGATLVETTDYKLDANGKLTIYADKLNGKVDITFTNNNSKFTTTASVLSGDDGFVAGQSAQTINNNWGDEVKASFELNNGYEIDLSKVIFKVNGENADKSKLTVSKSGTTGTIKINREYLKQVAPHGGNIILTFASTGIALKLDTDFGKGVSVIGTVTPKYNEDLIVPLNVEKGTIYKKDTSVANAYDDINVLEKVGGEYKAIDESKWSLDNVNNIITINKDAVKNDLMIIGHTFLKVQIAGQLTNYVEFKTLDGDPLTRTPYGEYMDGKYTINASAPGKYIGDKKVYIGSSQVSLVYEKDFTFDDGMFKLRPDYITGDVMIQGNLSTTTLSVVPQLDNMLNGFIPTVGQKDIVDEFQDGNFVIKADVKSVAPNAFYDSTTGTSKLAVLADRHLKLTAQEPGWFSAHQLTKIGESAFQESPIEMVNLTNAGQLTTIDRYAFRNCANVTEFKFPQNTKVFKENIFAGCKSVRNIYIPHRYGRIFDTIQDNVDTNAFNGLPLVGEMGGKIFVYDAEAWNAAFTLPSGWSFEEA